VLLRTHGWVPAFELARVGGLQFQTRIWELRHKFGLVVENKVERGDDGTVLSFYRLVRGFKTEPSVQTGGSASSDGDAQSLLFDVVREHCDLG
jgi:hypothetical protein